MSFRKLSPPVVAAIVLLLVVAARANATPQQFPYSATVQTDELEVRAGPSEENYYVTGKLSRGQQVTVHRHDRGGWYMISPPPGSFSWIEASVVERQGGDVGVVSVPMDGAAARRAIVRIGSQISDAHSLYGRELSSGDRVRILGEQTLDTESGTVLMLKIEPPAREYRWVKGDFLVAVDANARRQQDLDPYRIPSSQFHSLEYAEIVTASSSEPAAETEQSSELKTKLGEIDIRYAEMMQSDPSQWDLDQLEHEYLALRPQGDVRFQGQVDQRLRALGARRQIHNDFLRLQEIRDATTARDAQLQAMQQQTVVQGNPVMSVDLGTPGEFPSALPADLAQQPIYPDAFPSAAPSVTGFTTETAEVPTQPADAATIGADQLCGAGILQKVEGLGPGQPTHALISPDGRLLTLVIAQGEVDLTSQEGNPVGLVGERAYNDQFQADLATVRQIVPVQLVQ